MSARPGYEEYMRSPAWAAKRQQRLELDGHKCRTCGCTFEERPLQVHHVTYERLGHEELSDLITLCRSCHEAITGVMRRRRYDGRRIEVEFEEFVSSFAARVEVNYGMAGSEVRTEIIVSDARSQRQGSEPTGPVREDDERGFEQAEQDRRRLRAAGAD